VTEDLHTPTTAGPEPATVVPPAPVAPPHPPGDTAPESPSSGPLANLPVDVEEHPEVLVGAAFVGGILAAMVLKRLGR
jgi:hypothetical protein